MALRMIHTLLIFLSSITFIPANGIRPQTGIPSQKLVYDNRVSLNENSWWHSKQRAADQQLGGVGRWKWIARSSRCAGSHDLCDQNDQVIKSASYSLVSECKDCTPLSPPPLPSDRRKKGFTHAHILLGTLIGALVLVMVCWLIFYCLKKHCIKLFQFSETGEAEKVLALESTSGRQSWMLYIRSFSLKELEIATKKFSSDCLIGSGAFGKVYKGVLNTNETVAIKRPNGETFQGDQEFHNEVKLLSKIHHKNLVSLVGLCEEAGEQILVYEYIPNGSLLEHISGQKDMPLTWRERIHIAIGAAKGIAYLHEGCKPAIIHRDIKPSNILLDYDFEAKVSDFGLVKAGPVGDQSHVSSQVKGTPGYLDPYYYSSYHLTTFSDVYSFGIILLQLVTARPAVDLTRKRSHYNIIDWARPSLEQGNLEDILDVSLLTQPYNHEILLEMGQLGLRCVRRSPKERPTMRQVCEELECALGKIQILFQIQPSNSFNKEEKSSKSGKEEDRESFVSMENAGLQKFHVELEYVSFDSINMRCLECNSISKDTDNSSLGGIWEEGDTNSSTNTTSLT
eukprot:Gb_20176 [translate_table: standard]